MKNRLPNYVIFLIFLIGVIIGIIIFNKVISDNNYNNKIDNSIEDDNIEFYENYIVQEVQIESETLSEEQKEELDEVMNKQLVTGDSELYEVQEGYNNEKIVLVKPSIKYKVAFSGMIKDSEPEIDEVDEIVTQNHPKYAGIWVEEESQQSFLEMIKKYVKSEYTIDESGYLRVENKEEQNDYDKKIQRAINGKKLFIISISDICYIVDDVTGEILDYDFGKISRDQAYEYFNDNDKYIVFITENKYNLLTEKEIFESLIDLIS